MSAIEELKKAQEEGKRIVLNVNGIFIDCPTGEKWDFIGHESRYRIVDHDYNWRLFTVDRTQPADERDTIVIQLTKSGINGKISAKVV